MITTVNVLISFDEDLILQAFNKNDSTSIIDLQKLIELNPDAFLFNNRNSSLVKLEHSLAYQKATEIIIEFLDPLKSFEDKLLRSNPHGNFQTNLNNVYIAYGTGDKISDWAGPFYVELVDAEIEISDNTSRKLVLTFVPQLCYHSVGFPTNYTKDLTKVEASSKEVLFRGYFGPMSQDISPLISELFVNYIKVIGNLETKDIISIFPKLVLNTPRETLELEGRGDLFNPFPSPIKIRFQPIFSKVYESLSDIGIELQHIQFYYLTHLGAQTIKEYHEKYADFFNGRTFNERTTKRVGYNPIMIEDRIVKLKLCLLKENLQLRDRDNKSSKYNFMEPFNQFNSGAQKIFYPITSKLNRPIGNSICNLVLLWENNPKIIKIWKAAKIIPRDASNKRIAIVGDSNLISSILYGQAFFRLNDKEMVDILRDMSKDFNSPLYLNLLEHKKEIMDFSKAKSNEYPKFSYSKNLFELQNLYLEKKQIEELKTSNKPIFKHNVYNPNVIDITIDLKGHYLVALLSTVQERELIQRAATFYTGLERQDFIRFLNAPTNTPEQEKIVRAMISILDSTNKNSTKKVNEWLLKRVIPLKLRTLPAFHLSQSFLVNGAPCSLISKIPDIITTTGEIKNEITFYSGDYEIFGFKHTISNSGIYSEFNLLKIPSGDELNTGALNL